ncbi:hypothetical protein DMC01_06405 [Campylobacter troglodytis]|nr:hypothetical protein DMC01_06405 [Campylobacter troglodytis]
MTTFFCHIELRLKDLFLALLLKRASINTFLNDQFKLNLIFHLLTAKNFTVLNLDKALSANFFVNALAF